MPAASKKAPGTALEKLQLRAQIEAALNTYLEAGRSIEQVPPRVAPEVPPLARHGSLVPEESSL